MSNLTIKEIKDIADQDEARDTAIYWQDWASEKSLSYTELAEWGAYFTELGKKFNLTEEFTENGII